MTVDAVIQRIFEHFKDNENDTSISGNVIQSFKESKRLVSQTEWDEVHDKLIEKWFLFEMRGGQRCYDITAAGKEELGAR